MESPHQPHLPNASFAQRQKGSSRKEARSGPPRVCSLPATAGEGRRLASPAAQPRRRECGRAGPGTSGQTGPKAAVVVRVPGVRMATVTDEIVAF